jgi:hypothetical protein
MGRRAGGGLVLSWFGLNDEAASSDDKLRDARGETAF